MIAECVEKRFKKMVFGEQERANGDMSRCSMRWDLRNLLNQRAEKISSQKSRTHSWNIGERKNNGCCKTGFQIEMQSCGKNSGHMT